MNPDAPCPCYSNLTYEACCRPYHLGTAPERAEALMRSRYCAYALQLPDYLIATTHPKNQQYTKNTAAWKKNIQKFAQETQFVGLEILQATQGGTDATVTFKAGLLQGLKDASFTEKSTFEKVGGRWLYLAGSNPMVRNNP
jgi:SEC-C motif-containing protein